jgi:hypothetical protein
VLAFAQAWHRLGNHANQLKRESLLMSERQSTLPPRRAVAAALGAIGLIFAAPALAGPPYRTDDPEPVEYQHWEVYGFTTGTHIQGDTSGTLPGFEVNYGAAPNLQLHLVAPLTFDKPSGGSRQYGYGDTEVGAKYRFIDEDEHGWRPQVGTFPLVEVPTGDRARGLGAGHTREFIPIWVQKSFGEWTTYGGGGYWINPGAGNKNYWYAGWLLQRKVTEQLTLGGELFHQTANTVGGPDSTGFNLGGYYDVTEHHHILFSGGRGIQHAAETNEISWYLGYQLTF